RVVVQAVEELRAVGLSVDGGELVVLDEGVLLGALHDRMGVRTGGAGPRPRQWPQRAQVGQGVRIRFRLGEDVFGERHVAGVNLTGSAVGERKTSPRMYGSVSPGWRARFGNRSRTWLTTTRVSRRARCMPRHMCGPWANAMWGIWVRKMSNVS